MVDGILSIAYHLTLNDNYIQSRRMKNWEDTISDIYWERHVQENESSAEDRLAQFLGLVVALMWVDLHRRLLGKDST